ncbi:STAS domain-containing protein [Kitasatospora sp. NPDC057940]|uniref:STAS domain-containing protein n=1 Tax=Kitasatospora sp. NPDC057940 TaxID=3346285 RepID=UPI0036DDECBC
MSARHGPDPPGACADPALRITTADLAGYTSVVCLEGEVDLGQRGLLQDALACALENGLQRLVVDLSRLVFCDCTGLNALLQTRLDAHACGIELVLAAPLPQTRRLLEISGTNEVFTIRPSVRAALPSAGAVPPAR